MHSPNLQNTRNAAATRGCPDPEREVVLDEATSLARKGRYSDALQLLRTLQVDLPQDRLEILDLSARIYAQQGRWLDAERYWQEAIRIDPGNPIYRHGLDAVQKRGNDFRPIAWSAIVLLLTLAAICTWRLLHYANSMQTQMVELTTRLDVMEQLARTQQDVINQRFTETDTRTSVAALERHLTNTDKVLQATTQAVNHYHGENQDTSAALAKSIQAVLENITSIGHQFDAANKTASDSVKALSADTTAFHNVVAAQDEQRGRVLDRRLNALDEAVAKLAQSIDDLSNVDKARAEEAKEQLVQLSQVVGGIEQGLPTKLATTRPTSQPSH